jgi:outer membrane protein assembly factor BamB
LDAKTGKVRWKRSFWATGRTMCHPLTSMAAPTPASDGKRIFAFFASNDLFCLDLQGNVLWMRGLGLEFPYAIDDRGLASSPVVVSGSVVVQIECQGESFAAALDAESGATRWRLDLSKTTNWASPLIVRWNEADHVLIQSAERLLLLEPERGEIRWEHAARGSLIPSPTIAQGRVFLPAAGLTVIGLPDADGKAEVVWEDSRLGPQSASPIVGLGKVFVVRSPNILVCGDAESGEVLWRERLKGERFWATPVLVGNHLCLPNSDGVVFVVDVSGEKPRVISEYDFGEEMLGSPAADGNALYFRSVGAVWKVE